MPRPSETSPRHDARTDLMQRLDQLLTTQPAPRAVPPKRPVVDEEPMLIELDDVEILEESAVIEETSLRAAPPSRPAPLVARQPAPPTRSRWRSAFNRVLSR